MDVGIVARWSTLGVLHATHRIVSGSGVTAVVGAGRDRSDWLSLLVDCVPQRLVLILRFPAVGLPEI
jgi:hypothetical protein